MENSDNMANNESWKYSTSPKRLFFPSQAHLQMIFVNLLWPERGGNIIKLASPRQFFLSTSNEEQLYYLQSAN